MEALKVQFDTIATQYDSQRQQLIPCYQDFYTACYPLLAQLPETGAVLDIGAGTGLFSSFIYPKRPLLHYTLLDVAPEMLRVAQERFQGLPNFAFQVGDFRTEPLPGRYDLIISSLAIHHLADPDKAALYNRVYAALQPSGLFINADQVLGRTAGFDAFFRQDWRATVRQSTLPEEAVQKAFERTKLDQFGTLEAQLLMLETSGFAEVDCLYKNRSFVVFAAAKSHLLPVS